MSARLLPWWFVAVFFSVSIDAETLQPLSFKNQWGEEIHLDATTELVLLSAHKEGGEWIQEAMANLNTEDLKQYSWLYVADVSGMPRIITSLFTLPKMRKYPWPVALVRDHDRIAGWPSKHAQVITMRLQNLEVLEERYFSDAVSLSNYLQALR